MKTTWLAGALVVLAVPALAQQPVIVGPSRSADAVAASQARFRIRVMEGVLERAVQDGARIVSVDMRRVSPDVALFSGPARARGFRLDGYGVFFSVDVPALHRSISWSVRTITQSNADLTRALESIRQMVQTQRDARMKSELEQALRLVELQVGPPLLRSSSGADTGGEPERVAVAGRPQAAVAVTAAATEEPGGAEEAKAFVFNPDEAYTSAVQTALVDAMLDYGVTLGLGGDEWLTVAARENTDTILAADLTETVTITLRLKGADLAALREGRLVRDDARRRVEVREF